MSVPSPRGTVHADPPRETTFPPGYMESCDDDAGCDSGLSCHGYPDEDTDSERICTTVCTSDDEWPAGPVQWVVRPFACPRPGCSDVTPPLRLPRWRETVRLTFSWDPAKNDANAQKHGVSFGEAQVLYLSGED